MTLATTGPNQGVLLALSSTSGQVNVFVGSISGGLFSFSIVQGSTILASTVADVSGVDIPLVYSGTSGGGTPQLKIVSYNGATPIINVRPSTWVTTWTPQTVMATVCNGVEDRYRFGFNGQEKVNEVAGLGNHNTALFWEYDTRLGRRWNLDPKPTFGISDYSVMGSNPISMIDELGDKFDRRSKSTLDKFKSETRANLAKNNAEIKRLQDAIGSMSATAKREANDQIVELKQANSEFNAALAEVSQLEASSQLYQLRENLPLLLPIDPARAGENITYQSGGTYYDPITKAVVMTGMSIGDIAHELKHGYQFETGNISFGAGSNWHSGSLHDLSDEREAYNRETYYSGQTELRGMSDEQIRKRGVQYSTLLPGPLNTRSLFPQVYGAADPGGGLSSAVLSQMTFRDFQMKLPVNKRQAFR